MSDITVKVQPDRVVVVGPVPTTNVVVRGPQGIPGRDGEDGTDGQDGQVFTILGTLPDGNPPVAPGTNPGDCWLDPTGGAWVWDGTAWQHVVFEGTTDHGALEGLADDDHPQYHTDARGDARYDAIGAAAGAVTAHEAAADPHPGYLTPADADPVYEAKAAKGAVNGYAALDASGLVPVTQLPPVGVSDHGALSGLSDADHPIAAVQNLQAELDARPNQTYVDALTTVAAAPPVDGVDVPSRDGLLWFVVEA